MHSYMIRYGLPNHQRHFARFGVGQMARAENATTCSTDEQVATKSLRIDLLLLQADEAGIGYRVLSNILRVLCLRDLSMVSLSP